MSIPIFICIRFCTLTYGHYIYSLWATSPNLISWQIDSEWHCISLPGPYLIPQPTGCEWYFICSLKGSFIQITSHDQQGVGVITFFPLQAVSCTSKCHPTTDSMSVPVYFSLPTGSFGSQTIPIGSECYHTFSCQAVSFKLISWPTGCEWHYIFSLQGSFIKISYHG